MRPLLVIQYWDYQYHQIKPFIDLIDPALILVRLTTEESLAGINRSGYRLVNREEGSISEEEFSEMQISDLGLDLSYVIYTGVPYSGLDRLAQATEKGFCACIGHSLICSRYDSKLVLPTTRRCIGLVPECWTTFSIFAAVAGIMVYISLDELLPTAEKYGEHHIAIYGLISGMMVMSVSLLLFA